MRAAISTPKSSGGNGTQQGALHALRGLQLALHAGFVARNLFVEARIFERHSQLRGQDGERLHMVLGEIVQLRAFEIEHADDAALVNHGNGQFRARLRIEHDVARLLGHVGNAHGLAGSGGGADDAFGGGDAQLALHALAILHRQTLEKQIWRRVVEHDAHDLVIDHALDQFGGAAQQRFHIENGAGFAANFVEQ